MRPGLTLSSLDEIPLPPGPGSFIPPTRQHPRPSCPGRAFAFRKFVPRAAAGAKVAGARFAGAEAWVTAGLHPRREKMGGVWTRTRRLYHGAPWDWLATAGPRPQPGSRHAPSGEPSGARCEAAGQVRARCEPGASPVRARCGPSEEPSEARTQAPFSG